MGTTIIYMFIRIKRHKKLRYAYLVMNKRYKTKSYHRQKVLAYLGKVITPKKTQNLFFKDFINQDLKTYIKNTKTKNIFLDLINLELKKHDLNLNPDDMQENIVYEINEGFLCNYTLKQLLNFKLPMKVSDKEASITLAKTILEAGIKISPTLFIQIFKKLKY